MKIYNVYVSNQRKKENKKIGFLLELIGLFVVGAYAGAAFFLNI